MLPELQHQIVVLLRRCHTVFPYFQTQNINDRKSNKYPSVSHKELFECIEELKKIGFDTASYLDEEIYSQHSRFIESDDMMHQNPLSLFSLLPNKFIQIYRHDIIESIQFLFNYHESITNDTLLFQRQREESLNRITSTIKLINKNLAAYLKGEKQIYSHSESFSERIYKKSSNYDNNTNNNKAMPSRIYFYV